MYKSTDLTSNDSFYKSDRLYKAAIGLILLFGIVIRLFHFFYNRSLWEDEIYLSAGIIDMDLWQLLTKPLPYFQKAPIGYLLISKLMVMLFGKNEMSLRLYPLMSGIISLILFYSITRRYLKPVGVIVALCIVAFAPPLIYYHTEAKPYGTDMLATLMVLSLYHKYQRLTTPREAFSLGLLGAIIIWFAYPAIFVLAAAGITILIVKIRQKNKQGIQWLVLVGAVWIASFIVNYIFFTRDGSSSQWLVDFWEKHDAYMPLQPVAGFIWLFHHISSFFLHPLGFSWFHQYEQPNMFLQLLNRLFFLPLILSALGVIYYWLNNKKLLLYCSAVLSIAFAVAALHQYPFHERLTVYLVPFMVLLIAGGVQFCVDRAGAVKWLGYVAGIFIISALLKNSVEEVVHPALFGGYKRSYQRDAMAFIGKHYQPGDLVYVYYNELPNFLFYQKMYPQPFKKVILGADHRRHSNNFSEYFSLVDRDIQNAGKDKRIWVIYNVIDAPLGEYLGDPAWYYHDNDAVNRLHKHLRSEYKVLTSFAPKGKEATPDVFVDLIEK
ncbi:glycosyltransferase family 39 protein [Mucilaginibacter daejeonensis]|uniref:glycosyltransferase family 39 protein n=1 Tax=Mucilaginibacter daejeonensis TaxID=398049 RepID=UPI001D179F68|nr:glycosyltransferase family 39 protein [Mucilaginibacter daejeonensis]UEG54318.1 glycosyltransferase family 39 protein [Mucilaginibacter daejeonensis]